MHDLGVRISALSNMDLESTNNQSTIASVIEDFSKLIIFYKTDMTAATTKIESLEKLLTTPANVEVEEGSARSSEQAAEETTQSPPQQAPVQPISQQIVQKFGRFKMDQNTWVFNGTKDENIRDWLFQVKDQLDKSDMPSTEWFLPDKFYE